jgi:hypothetical protein
VVYRASGVGGCDSLCGFVAAVAALGVGFLLVYASKIEPPEWARVLLWLGTIFVVVETTVP